MISIGRGKLQAATLPKLASYGCAGLISGITSEDMQCTLCDICKSSLDLCISN